MEIGAGWTVSTGFLSVVTPTVQNLIIGGVMTFTTQFALKLFEKWLDRRFNNKNKTP